MRFFERLAPAARTEHAVQAALPPRFATAAPGIEEAPAEADPIHLAAAEREQSDMARPSGARRLAATPPQPAAVPTKDTVATAIGHAAPHGSVSQATCPPWQAPVPAPAAAAVPQMAHAGTAVPPPAQPIEAPPPGLPRDEDVRAPMPRGPLSPIALAQRIQPATREEQQVVHVTIDRIDVRAPAPATAPRSARPRTAPAMSLADYLRRGKA